MRTLIVTLSLAILASAANEERMRQLASQLGANGAAEREEAQSELEKLGTAPEGALKAELALTADPEARTRLEGLLRALEEDRALFEAIPPDRISDLSPLVHAFHAEWSAHLGEFERAPEERGCDCDFKSVEALVRSGGPAVRVLCGVIGRWNDQWTDEDGGPVQDFLLALIPPRTPESAPGLDELGPFYADLATGAVKSSFRRDDLLRALATQRSLGAGTALVAWVHSTRKEFGTDLTGGCTGSAAPLYNDLMSVQRALVENGDKRLVPLLVELMDPDDQSQSFAHIEGSFTVPSPTHLAIDVLRKITAQELPYDGLSPDRAARAESIAAWRAWYEAHKAEFGK